MARQKIFLRVIKGALVAADDAATDALRSRGFKRGDILLADLTKLRNPKFNRLVHRIGQLVVANVASFDGLDGHGALKRIQLEGNIACDEQMVDYPSLGQCLVRVPRSLSFDAMDEGEFNEVARAMCRHIAAKYWQDMTAEQIEEMANTMIDE